MYTKEELRQAIYRYVDFVKSNFLRLETVDMIFKDIIGNYKEITTGETKQDSYDINNCLDVLNPKNLQYFDQSYVNKSFNSLDVPDYVYAGEIALSYINSEHKI